MSYFDTRKVNNVHLDGLGENRLNVALYDEQPAPGMGKP